MNELIPSSFAEHEYWTWDEDADDDSLVPMTSIPLCDNGERDFNALFCLVTAECANGSQLPAIVGVRGSDLWVYVVELFARDLVLSVHCESAWNDTAEALAKALGDRAFPIVLDRTLEIVDCGVDVAIDRDRASSKFTLVSNSVSRARQLSVGAHTTLGGDLVVGPTVLLYGTPVRPESASVEFVVVANGAALRNSLFENIPPCGGRPALFSGHARVEGWITSAGGDPAIVANAVRFFRDGFTYDVPVEPSK